MTKALIITIAGTSSRFSQSLGQKTLKPIYKEQGDPSILDVLLDYAGTSFAKIIIVAGYKFSDVQTFIDTNYESLNITVIENDLYEHGSNISLIEGIKALDQKYDEIMFAEGDLIVDLYSFQQIVSFESDVITNTTIPIEAKTSVLYYLNRKNEIVYKYDTKHEFFKIDEEFRTINNSGQIWKFCDQDVLEKVANSFNQNDRDLTNLSTVAGYFNSTNNVARHYQIKKWFNCNTVGDYRKAMTYLRESK